MFQCSTLDLIAIINVFLSIKMRAKFRYKKGRNISRVQSREENVWDNVSEGINQLERKIQLWRCYGKKNFSSCYGNETALNLGKSDYADYNKLTQVK